MQFDQTSLKKLLCSTGNTGSLMPAPLRGSTSVVHRIRNLESNLAGY